MPELPEVECVRRSIAPALIGRTIGSVLLNRTDIVTGPSTPAALFAHQRVVALKRHGKQLALFAGDGRVLVVQLGMTGQLLVLSPREAKNLTHVHTTWALPAFEGMDQSMLVFRDPRRFGGLTPLASRADLDSRWKALGPDALTIAASDLASGLAGSRRAIKAALLDQSVLAGVGNIYADESLFAARLAPQIHAARLAPAQVAALAETIRATLTRAIDAGGSTLRDYVDGQGRPGGFAPRHQVYARAGQPCFRCGRRLSATIIAQRMTVWCRSCQPSVPSGR